MTRLDENREQTGAAAGGRLDRTSGVSLWRQILEVMKGEIASGLHEPGERLPTEQELSKRFRVNGCIRFMRPYTMSLALLSSL